VGLADLEKALIGVQTIGGQTQWQARVEPLERSRQAREGAPFTTAFS
jgi:hypothetical protein